MDTSETLAPAEGSLYRFIMFDFEEIAKSDIKTKKSIYFVILLLLAVFVPIVLGIYTSYRKFNDYYIYSGRFLSNNVTQTTRTSDSVFSKKKIKEKAISIQIDGNKGVYNFVFSKNFSEYWDPLLSLTEGDSVTLHYLGENRQDVFLIEINGEEIYNNRDFVMKDYLYTLFFLGVSFLLFWILLKLLINRHRYLNG